ncbi:MAG TPA: phosphopantetheine-binding protein [Sulfurovum sp.]|uniref:phosphopantetheine-binding protein n=1 Tax=Sulfurovum sp. TaxID=1969726 RepID=UPI002F94836B
MITSEDFKKTLIQYLNLEDITPDEINDTDRLFGDEGLGLDSVDSIELVLAIEKEYGVKIDDATLYQHIFASVENLLNYINENKK